MAHLKHAKPPSFLLKVVFRLPVYLFRLGLGRFLGQRFLWLHHIGRKSGQPRQNVLEVADYDNSNDIYYVVSGYGTKSQWYRNLQATPEANIQVGARKCVVKAEMLMAQESGQFLVNYAERNPKIIKGLTNMLGLPEAKSAAEYRQLGETVLNAVALHVTQESAKRS